MCFRLPGVFCHSSRRVARLTIFVLVLMMLACSHLAKPIYLDQSQKYYEAKLPLVRREEILNEISLYHGVPYLEGGCTLKGVDCSCLVQLVFRGVGVKLPRTVKEQYGCGLPRLRGEVMTGDLVFFGKGGIPSHVGIALSNSQIIHASRRGVVVDRIDDVAAAMGLVGVRRVVRLR